MKPLHLIATAAIAGTLSGCNSCSDEGERKYEVMQRYGGWQARMDETRAEVTNIEQHHREYDAYMLNTAEMQSFSSPYPFWEKVVLHSYDGDLKRAYVLANPEKSYCWEKFYFEDGSLIFACVNSIDSVNTTKPNEEYFFEERTLVFALDGEGQKRDITSDGVQLNAIDLLKEAKQLQGIFTTNNSKH